MQSITPDAEKKRHEEDPAPFPFRIKEACRRPAAAHRSGTHQ
jgi:hypothetical protein